MLAGMQRQLALRRSSAKVAPTAPLTMPLTGKKGFIACPELPSGKGSGGAVLGSAGDGPNKSTGVMAGMAAGAATGSA